MATNKCIPLVKYQHLFDDPDNMYKILSAVAAAGQKKTMDMMRDEPFNASPPDNEPIPSPLYQATGKNHHKVALWLLQKKWANSTGPNGKTCKRKP